MTHQEIFDLIVIGAGGGGYPAAFRLANADKRVLLIDSLGNLGGNCLYEGCVPSKAVRQATIMVYNSTQANFFGITSSRAAGNWSAIRAYKDGIQSRRYSQHRLEIAQTKSLSFIHGTGRLLDAHHVEVTDLDHSDVWTVEGRQILIATGSEPQSLPITGFEYTWSSHDLFAWQKTQEKLPQDLVILGGGYIGVETASMLSDLGIHITLIEMMPTILSGMDPDLITAVTANLSQRIELVTNVRVTAILQQDNQQFLVQGHNLLSGQRQQWKTSRVLAAAGRIPYIPPSLGLDHLGLAYTSRGIAVDPQMHTNIPSIYAAGDVTGLSMLFHSAVRMSEIAATAMLDPQAPDNAFNPSEMPITVFSRPEALAVGLTKEQAQQRGIKVHEYVRPMGVEAWAQIAGETEGFLKFIINAADGTIIGAHGVGACAAALSAALHMAVRLKLTPRALGQMTFPHPTQFEIIDRLARSI
ncbi:dihydrolipoyl dehydrogenase [Sulfobacillus thermosulfidooxidans]|uniref:dihydrolipoyl dehydrogenase n=1 Tax=Sulfobacillus thermosulfidooxidans TaxID=28034 RepID=UPI0004277D77|nr:dihydrolipoyl dehydrogenase [Sulfobacillus thermosulfidooxidans]